MPSACAIRPDAVPWDPARPLFESSLVGIGTIRMTPGHPELNRDRVAYVWPTLTIPRLPYSISFDREPPVQGDRNTAVFTSVGSVMRRQALTSSGVSNLWLDVHPTALADMLSAATGNPIDPDARFPWRSGPIPTAPLLAVSNLAAKLTPKARDHAEQRGGCARSDSMLQNPAARTRIEAFEIEETLLAVIGSMVHASASAQLPPRRRRPSPAQAAFQREAVDEVRRRLAIAPAEKHSLSDLARSVFVSPFHLCRVFKRHTGMPIHRYLERLRLRAAMESILDSRRRMLDIALEHGFCSEAHLSNAFLKEFGQRPTDLRRSRFV
ncbi:MAG: helix-turn-helix transcriptional regulator [Phycisphaerales bacterium]|nr:helix-turn-helix transcriptional regulator [Phycisphaerales bacterium]